MSREPPTENLFHQRCPKCGNTTATHSRHDWRELNATERSLFSNVSYEFRPKLIGRRHIVCECGFVEDVPEFFVP